MRIGRDGSSVSGETVRAYRIGLGPPPSDKRNELNSWNVLRPLDSKWTTSCKCGDFAIWHRVAKYIFRLLNSYSFWKCEYFFESTKQSLKKFEKILKNENKKLILNKKHTEFEPPNFFENTNKFINFEHS